MAEHETKSSKLPIARGVINYFPRALSEIARVSVWGAVKHGQTLNDKGFLRPEYTADMYEDAIMRHIVERAIEGETNPKDGDLLHRAQLAWDALASLEKYLIEQEKKEQVTDILNWGNEEEK